MTEPSVPHGRRTQREPAIPALTSSGSRPAWAVTATPSPSRPPPSPASKTSWAAPSRAARSTCTIRCWPTRTATTSWNPGTGPRGQRLDPFLLVVEGSIPNETNKTEGYWAAFGHGRGDRPADPDLRLDRPAGAQGVGGRGRRDLLGLRRHPRHGRQPDRLHGPARLPGLGVEIEGGHPDRLRARAVPCSRTTSWRRCSTCSTRRRAWRR